MSRIGKRKLVLPAGVTVTNENNVVTIKGPKGELVKSFDKNLDIKVEDNILTVDRPDDSTEMTILHGTTNALINNMIIGVSEGYKVELETVGVGYRFNLQGTKIVISAGYSHNVEMVIPAGVKAECPTNTEIEITGLNQEQITELAAHVRKIRKPEPYKGKGIRYKGEYVRRKDGKKAA